MSAESKYALVVVGDVSLEDKSKRALASAFNNFQPVAAKNVQAALDKLVHVTYEIIVLSGRGLKMSPDFVANKILQNKDLHRPKHFVFLEDAAKENGDGPKSDMNNITRLPDSVADEDFVKALQAINLSDQHIAQRAPASTKLDVNFINPFIESTLKVIETTCRTTCSKEKVFLRAADITSGDISALIGMISDKFKGSIAISFPKTTFLYLVNSMLDEKYTSITKENQDAAGELCNQIFGLTKTTMNDAGHTLKPAIPSIIVGDNHKIQHLYSTPVISVRFKCAGGAFVVETAVG